MVKLILIKKKTRVISVRQKNSRRRRAPIEIRCLEEGDEVQKIGGENGDVSLKLNNIRKEFRGVHDSRGRGQNTKQFKTGKNVNIPVGLLAG